MSPIDKVIRGAVKYGQSGAKDAMRKQMAKAKTSPQTSALFFTCMDSRLMPTRFTGTHDGSTLFLIRNAGNIVPGHCADHAAVATEPAALELACAHMGVQHVVVCGHSDCKAMEALQKKELTAAEATSPLSACLQRFGRATLSRWTDYNRNPASPMTFIAAIPRQTFSAVIDADQSMAVGDRLSQLHCLQQLENISTHTVLHSLLHAGTLHLHAMWFCVATGEVFFFDKQLHKFVILNEENADRLLDDD